MDCDVAVLGSLHFDIMVSGGRLPRRDETVLGESWRFKCGGKGGNQAVAAARFGARTVMGGRIGRDDFGGRLLANLKSEHVDCRCVALDDALGSGLSVAIEESEGDYGAVAVSGANRAVTGRELEGIRAPVLVLQNEIPHAANAAAARAPRLAGAVDLIIVNRIEARALVGVNIETLEDALRAAAALCETGCDAIVTAGKLGFGLARRGGESGMYPVLAVAQGSSHGAGDWFVGALAARLGSGEDIETAARFAGAAAALAVSGKGDLNASDVYAALRQSS